jgi:hypothetical protein
MFVDALMQSQAQLSFPALYRKHALLRSARQLSIIHRNDLTEAGNDVE